MVESTPLLRERGGDLTEGSNPSRSALTPIQFVWVGVMAFEEGRELWPPGPGFERLTGTLPKLAIRFPFRKRTLTAWKKESSSILLTRHCSLSHKKKNPILS